MCWGVVMQPSMGISSLPQTQICSKVAWAQNRKGLVSFNSQHALIFLLDSELCLFNIMQASPPQNFLLRTQPQLKLLKLCILPSKKQKWHREKLLPTREDQHTETEKKQNNYIRACCSELLRILDKHSTKSGNQSCRESKYLQIVVKTLVKQK